jgi:hypothetical protein
MKLLTPLFALLICITNCKKMTDSIDITKSDWTLDCIEVGRDKQKVRCKDCKNDLAYILTFENDTLFRMNTSVNHARGRYTIPESGILDVSGYGEISEACCTNALDDLILEKMNTVSSYVAYNNKIVLHGDNCEMTFLKRE